MGTTNKNEEEKLKTPKKNKKEEEELQNAVSLYTKANYNTLVFTSDKSGLFTSNFGGFKAAVQRSEDKIPDMIFFAARSGFSGLFMELKTPSVDVEKCLLGKRKSDRHVLQQNECMEKLRSEGYHACFVVGYQSAISLLDKYMAGQLIHPCPIIYKI